MGSYPLPALDVKPPAPVPDAIEQYGRLAALKNAMTMQPLQQQAAQQQVQSGALQNQADQVKLQQAQQGQQDQQATTTAMQNWDGKNLSDLPSLVLKHGGSAQAVMSLQQHVLEQKAKIATIAKDDAETGKNQIETSLKKNDAISGALSSVLQVSDDQLPQVLMSTAKQLQQQGLLDPQHVQQAQQLAQMGDPTKIRQQLDIMRKGIMSNTQLLDEAKSKADSGKAVADTSRAQAETIAIPANTANQTMARKQEQQRIGIEGARLAFEQKKYATENGTGGDGNALTDAIGSGHLAPDRMAYLLTKNPGLMQSVVQKYPDFDSSKVASYPQVYKDFTSGATSKALNAGGTALGHLAELKDLNTYSSRIPGTEAHQKYENKVDTLATELAKFYGDSTVSGIANIKSTLNANFNRDAAIQTQAQSMGDKLDAFQQQWENAAPSKAYQAPMPGISAKATAARERLAGNMSSTPPARPQGVPANAVWNAQGNNGAGSWQIK